ncbi:MAG: YifB family Mg chelatase-like AAA ATPase [Solirubrobacterales bacterium]
MLATVRAFTLDGVSARPVQVEADVHRGLPAFSIVGLPDVAVREARERVRAALQNCGFDFPQCRITVNLAPASLRKAGPGLDLAIALSLLIASGQVRSESFGRAAVTGELALDGAVRSVPGALAMAEEARRAGRAIVLPAVNGPEAALAGDVEVLPVESLAQLKGLADGGWRPSRPRPLRLVREAAEGPDLADLRGQPRLRFALEVAAAGGHSLLIVGPPGAGKSLAARRLPSILPAPGLEEALELARIASACGLLDRTAGRRPFRAPHHTISVAGLVGGGNPPRPGEVTLAHGGVLFLDEIAEFRRDALEALRGPLEDRQVTISRTGSGRCLPCDFMLVAAANPCPCGRGEADPGCRCTPLEVSRYARRLSGALADRMDIVVSVSQPAPGEIAGPPGEGSAAIRERVAPARARQEARLGAGRRNAAMTPAQTRDAPLSGEASEILAAAYRGERLSGRAHDRVIRVARTIADLEATDEIGPEALARALELRRREET